MNNFIKHTILISQIIVFVLFLSFTDSLWGAIEEPANVHNVHQGVQFLSATSGQLSSSTMQFDLKGGVFEKQEDGQSACVLKSGNILSCAFNLPQNAFDVHVKLSFKVQNSDTKVSIFCNNNRLSEELFNVHTVTDEMIQKDFILEKTLSQNTIHISSQKNDFYFYVLKIEYKYPLPYCVLGDSVVMLDSPISTDILQKEEIRIAWHIKSKNNVINSKSNLPGWIVLKYLRGNEWKTIPGAECIDCWKKSKQGTFKWKNHGLTSIPSIKIIAYPYKQEKTFDKISVDARIDYQNIPISKRIVLVKKELEELEKEELKELNDFTIGYLNDCIKRDRAYLNQTLPNIHSKITVFEPEPRTWSEASKGVLFYFNGDMRINESIKRDILKRKIVDMSKESKYKLMNTKDINYHLDKIDEIRLFWQNFQCQIDEKIEITNLNDLLFSKSKLNMEIERKKINFMSYSVISPYLADIYSKAQWDSYLNQEEKKKVERDLSVIIFILHRIQNQCSGPTWAKFLQNCPPPIQQRFKYARSQAQKREILNSCPDAIKESYVLIQKKIIQNYLNCFCSQDVQKQLKDTMDKLDSSSYKNNSMVKEIRNLLNY